MGAQKGSAFNIGDWIGFFWQWEPWKVLERERGRDHKRRDDTVPRCWSLGQNFYLVTLKAAACVSQSRWDCRGLGAGSGFLSVDAAQAPSGFWGILVGVFCFGLVFLFVCLIFYTLGM